MNLLDLLLELVAERMGVADVDPDRLFIDYGIGSTDAVALAGVLAEHTGTELPNSAFYEHPTPRALAAHLEEVRVGGPAPAPGDSTGPGAFPSASTGIGGLAAEPVAIVGIGCRLPGAGGPGELWELLTSGTDLVGPVPAARAERDEGWAEPGVGMGGFLPEVEAFDPAFFSINAREAAAMDPQQRMLLEVAHEALQDAGLRLADVTRTATGVFVGISSSDYLVGRFSGGLAPDAYTPTGTAHSVAANRISYVFDLHGPSMAIDTACSSSLVAIHQAALALRTGQCDVALAGGVNAVLSPDIGRCFRTAGVLAPDGRCKSFGAGADGMGRSEGTVMVALKRLPDALAAGDRVYALIRGGAVNSDGRTNGLMSPSAPAQVRLLRAACQAAGVAPGQVEYVEAHGSGTRLGDLMELRALSEVLGTAQRPEPLPIGSLKSNLGHLEAAAGAAGVAKVALALFHGVLPGGLHADRPAEDFAWDAGGLRVLTGPEPWDGRLAGVSSFGFGGTNAHLIL
ncbi:type I polyketide synthase, partial [Nonomuraea zeae]